MSQHSSQPTQSQQAQGNSNGKTAAAAKRRSTRIERSVPLIVLGKSQTGEPFMERTASVTLSKHGCRYPSRFDYGVGTSVTLQLMGSIGGDVKPQNVRATVRSIHPPASLRELQQVGVELETPANVWGIASAPADWTGTVESKTGTIDANLPTAQLVGAVGTSPEVEANIVTLGVAPPKPEPKMQDVASFPLPAPLQQSAAQAGGAAPAKRVVVTPEGLISALQGKLQQEAEKAVQAALAKQVNDGIQDALRSINEARELSVREVKKLVATEIDELKRFLKTESAAQIDEVKRSVKEEFAAQSLAFTTIAAAQREAEIEAHRGRAKEITQQLETQSGELRRELANAAHEYAEKMTREIEAQIRPRLTEASNRELDRALNQELKVALNEALKRATSEFESATAAVVERSREQLLEKVQSATQEAFSNLNARSAELLELSQNAANSGLEEFRRETERHAKMAEAESQQRVVSALASLESENRAACDSRRQALEADVARSGELAVEEFRKGMKAFLYSCLVAAVDAVDDHSKTTLKELERANERGRGKLVAESEDEIGPNAGNDLLTH